MVHYGLKVNTDMSRLHHNQTNEAEQKRRESDCKTRIQTPKRGGKSIINVITGTVHTTGKGAHFLNFCSLYSHYMYLLSP